MPSPYFPVSGGAEKNLSTHEKILATRLKVGRNPPMNKYEEQMRNNFGHAAASLVAEGATYF
jgi:hypothetical protein